jgi:hypothetical protein
MTRSPAADFDAVAALFILPSCALTELRELVESID